MKKQILTTAVIVSCLALLATGCGSSTVKLYDYDLSKYVQLGQYKGLDVPVETVSVTDDEVQAEIQNRLAAAATTDNVTEGVVKEGDTVNIDYAGTIDGQPFDGGSDTGKDLVIGSGTFIPGFEEGLVGKNIGDKVVLDVTFPQDYQSPDLAGKAAEFSVTINSVKVSTPAVLDAAFAEANGGYKTVAEYEDSVKADLLKTKQTQADNQRGMALWQKVVDGCKVLDYPQTELNAAIDESNTYYRGAADQMGVAWADFLAQNLKVTQDQYDSTIQEMAKQQIGMEMILVAIARTEGLEITDKEYKDGKIQYLKDNGYDSEKAYEDANGGKTLEDNLGQKNIELYLTYTKLMKFIEDNSVSS